MSILMKTIREQLVYHNFTPEHGKDETLANTWYKGNTQVNIVEDQSKDNGGTATFFENGRKVVECGLVKLLNHSDRIVLFILNHS